MKEQVYGQRKQAGENNRIYVKKALQMAWPSVLESFFIALIGMVDSLMVSSIGAYAVAAVGLTTQPKFLALSIFIAMNVAVSALVARRKGEGRRQEANRVMLMAVIFAVGATVLVSLVCVVFADPIISACGSDVETHGEAVAYFRIIMSCIIFMVISWMINSAQRGCGNTKISMRTNIISNLVNVGFNYLLIGGHLGFPALGIKGAAIATVLGTVVGMGMSIASLMKKDGFLSISYILKEKIMPSTAPIRSMAKISSSVFLEQVLMRIGFMSTAVMAAKLGTDAFAAHQVGMNVLSLSFSFGDGMQVAAVSLIGQSLGQGSPELAKTYGKICRRIGLCISLVLAIVYFFGGAWLYSLFFQEEHIIAMGVALMRLIIIIVLFQISQVIYNGCLRGAGDVVYTTISSTVSVTFVRTVAGYVFAYTLGLGLNGIWLGILADQISRFTFSSIRFRSGVWTKVKI